MLYEICCQNFLNLIKFMFIFTKCNHYELLLAKKDEFPFLFPLARAAGLDMV